MCSFEKNRKFDTRFNHGIMEIICFGKKKIAPINSSSFIPLKSIAKSILSKMVIPRFS